MSSNSFSVDTAQMRSSGEKLEAKGNEMASIHTSLFNLINQARTAMGNDNNGRAMARKLAESGDQTGTAVRTYAQAVQRGGQGIQKIADAFVATEQGATQAAKNLGEAASAVTPSNQVSAGSSSSSGSAGNSSGGSSKNTGKR